MIFRWLRQRRRKKLLATPLPRDWDQMLDAALPWFRHWDSDTRSRTIDNVRLFVSEKNWEGCNGQEINDEVQVVIAAQAAMMLVGIENYCFEGIKSVLVYPSSFRRETRQGMIVSETSRIGEAWQRGPIILSWADMVHVIPGRNVAVHELAHHLDGLDGEMGGSPVFGDAETSQRWHAVLDNGLQQLVSELNAGRRTFLDPYAASNRAEYFAVACEAYFELPNELKRFHPEIYRCLTEYFHIDPANWLR